MSAEVSVWIDPDGSSTTLDVDWNATGRFMPAISIASTGIPAMPGERLREVRHGVREFTLRLTLATADEGSLRQAQRALVYAMDPARGEGILRVTSPLGDTREISCVVVEGLGMQEAEEMSGPNMQFLDVTFRAYTDPYWRDVSDTSPSPYVVGLTPTFFPIFPLRLTSSQIAVDTTILNDGDVESWPVWQIAGPGSAITLRNLTTGKFMSFTFLAMNAGESVTIDTRPGEKTVIKSDNTPIFFDLSALSSMWPLIKGNNAIRLEMGGAIAGSSYLQLNFRKRYLAP